MCTHVIIRLMICSEVCIHVAPHLQHVHVAVQGRYELVRRVLRHVLIGYEWDVVEIQRIPAWPRPSLALSIGHAARPLARPRSGPWRSKEPPPWSLTIRGILEASDAVHHGSSHTARGDHDEDLLPPRSRSAACSCSTPPPNVGGRQRGYGTSSVALTYLYEGPLNAWGRNGKPPTIVLGGPRWRPTCHVCK